MERDWKERNCKRISEVPKWQKWEYKGLNKQQQRWRKGRHKAQKGKQNNTERKGGEIIRMVKYKISKLIGASKLRKEKKKWKKGGAPKKKNNAWGTIERARSSIRTSTKYKFLWISTWSWTNSLTQNQGEFSSTHLWTTKFTTSHV